MGLPAGNLVEKEELNPGNENCLSEINTTFIYCPVLNKGTLGDIRRPFLESEKFFPHSFPINGESGSLPLKTLSINK